MARKKLDEYELKALLQQEISAAESYMDSELTPDRQTAILYYQGEVPDVPAMDGRSKYTSRDTANVIGWTLPGIMRVFTASDRIVNYMPENENDEEGAEQASDYINYTFWRDNPGYKIMWDATWDALANKDAFVKQFWDISEHADVSFHTGVTEDQIAVLLDTDDDRDESEIVDQSKPYQQEIISGVDEMGQPVVEPITLFDVKLKRTTKQGRLTYQVVAPENFLINENALDLKDYWRFQAEKVVDVTRSDLLRMGFSRDRVDAIPAFSVVNVSPEAMARRNLISGQTEVGDTSMERVDLYECYIKMDINGDGIAEVVKAMWAGNSSGAEILDWEEWEDETPYSKIPCIPLPHRFESESLADKVMDIQKFKTVVGRQMIDNLYLSNLPQPIFEENSVLNMEAVVNPGLGVPIILKKGSQPIGWNVTPFIGDKALLVMNHFDEVMTMRTGVSPESLSLNADVLQNQTATASNNADASRFSQIELIARNQAEIGWKDVFAKSLRITVKNQDRPRTIRLRDKWVEMDPRYWNANMDAVIDVGMGTGSRDRDMMMLERIGANQLAIADRFAATGFGDKALEMLPKIVKGMVKHGEAAGVKSPEAYYPSVNEEDMAAMKQQYQQMQQQPDPEMQKAQAKIEADTQIKQADMQMKAQQSQAQMQMDAQKTQADMAMKQQEGQQKAQYDAQKMQMEMALKREQIAAEMQLKRETTAAELELKRQQLNAELQMSQQQWAAEFALQREQAAAGLDIKEQEVKAKSSKVRTGGKPG
jgi:hypothetical protein